jgi:hypothetical protein
MDNAAVVFSGANLMAGMLKEILEQAGIQVFLFGRDNTPKGGYFAEG